MSTKKQTWASAHSQLWTSPVPRSTGSRTQSEVSSIATPNRDRSLLDDTDHFSHVNDVSALNGSQLTSTRVKEKTLVQVSDILESYGAISKETDIPAVLLNVVRELEQTKQENNFKDLLLREYGDAVRRRFSLYGEDSPPTVAELSKRLREGATARPVAAPTPVWLEEQLTGLRRAVQEEARACFREEIDFSLPTLLPDAANTKSNVSHVLQQCRDQLVRLSREYRDAKCIVAEKLARLSPASAELSTLTLAEALAELDSRETLESRGETSGKAAESGKGSTFREALQSVIDTVPASLQIHFQLQVSDAPVRGQCDNLAALLKFLLSEYLSMERYMEEVGTQRLKLTEVFRLPSNEFPEEATDANAQIDDALSRSLEALKKTVAAVATFPHHISEEEISLRRASAEAVGELAQLLVDSRHIGNVASTAVSHHTGCGSSLARIEPPTHNLLEMVEMVKSRFATLFTQHQRKELAGAQGRVGFAHMEEAMKNYGKQVMQQLRELCVMQDGGCSADQSEALSELMGSVDVERNLTPTKLDQFLTDVMERLRVIKTKYQRALNAAASNKTRADAAVQKCAAAQKKLHKVAVGVERLGKDGLGLAFPPQLSATAAADVDDLATRGGAGGEGEGGLGAGASALRRLNLRPASDAPTHKAPVSGGVNSATSAAVGAAGTVTEANVLEALQFLAARVGTDDVLRDKLKLREEVEELRSNEARWKADTTAFHEAMAMLMRRLASNGQLVKQSLFMMGTDEASKDEVVEGVLQHSESRSDDEAEVEYVERSLAELLHKYTRWAQRLQQTTEDHLYTQRKIVKYFAAVRRFFTSQQGKDVAPPEDIPDDNLYDIDACLMRAADVILPALDAAIQGVEVQGDANAREKRGTAGDSSLPSASLSTGVRSEQRQEAISQLVKDSAAAIAGGVLPYDHRIARLYETVARLYTAVASLLQVHYLSIPSAVRRRSTGDTELVFEGDSNEDGFVDIDLERLIWVSQRRGGDLDGADAERFSREGAKDTSRGTNSPPPSTVAANNDVILRVTYQNMEVLQDMLKRFSANHKMAAIVLRKDVDAMQQQLASMLEKYSEVDMEAAFHQSRDELHGLYVTLRDRAQVQKGCYFFNRVGGDGSCTWLTALERLGEGFCGVVDRLVQRTAQTAGYRELVDNIVDTCAMYVNWAEHHPLPTPHALSPELLALCLRDNKGAGEVTTGAVAAGSDVPLQSPPTAGVVTVATQRPPKPNSTPSLTPRDSIKQQQESQAAHGAMVEADASAGDAAKEPRVSCFTEDRAVLKVMEHMFRLAQYNAEAANATAGASAKAAAQEAETRIHQLAEELALLREAAMVAERHVDELTAAKQAVERQRDQAQSEAAVARAELRRWKRLQQQRADVVQSMATPQRVCEGDGSRAIIAQSPSHTPQPSSASDTGDAPRRTSGSSAVMDGATVREVMAYLRVLSEELQLAKQQAGAGPQQGEHPHQWRQHQKPEGAVEEDELVRSPYSADLGGRGEATARNNFPGGHEDVPSHGLLPSNRYSALAEELRHRYGASSLAPMVVVDPQTHYSAHHEHTPRHSVGAAAAKRYTPVKFHGPAYDACDRYYSRELTDGEGERGAERAQRHGGLVAAAPPSASPSHTRTPQRRPSRRDSLGEDGASYEAFFDDDTGRRGTGLTSSTTPQRYPRSLTRDRPLRAAPTTTAATATATAAGPRLATTASSPRVYQAAQRATPVAAVAHASPSSSSDPRRRSSAVVSTAADADDDIAKRSSDEEEREEVFYDDAHWHTSLHGRRRASTSAVQRRTSSASHAAPSFSSTRSTSPGASSTTPSVSGRVRAAPDHDLGTNLAEAVQQIEAATQRGRPTPTRRRTQADSRREGGPVPPTPEQQINKNANLRSTALRRLAEVVSHTKVTPPRGARF